MMTTIAETLIAIDMETPKVYQSGRQSMIDKSKLIKKSISGSFLNIDDASEIPHDIELQISNDDTVDFSNISIRRCGKNIVDINAVFPNFVNEYNGISYTNSNAFTIHKSHMNIHTRATVTISADYEITTDDPNKEYVLTVVTFDESGAFIGSSSRVKVSGHGEGKISFTCSNVASVSFSYDTSAVVANIVLKNVQIEVGETSTEYERYICETATADTNGSVMISSLSPYMNIFSDTEGINIAATYHQSWGMTEKKERFYNNFKRGLICETISFEWLYLTKASIISIVNALSNAVTNQTLIFNASVVNTAFQSASGAADGSSSAEWNSLLATKPNWTITLA